MLRRIISRLGAASLAAAITVGPTVAQTSFGVVRGTIQDSTKAPVPKAKVTLRNQNTNISRESTLSLDGIYYFGEIQPGNYELTVEAVGFKKWVGTMALEVGQTAVVDA